MLRSKSVDDIHFGSKAWGTLYPAHAWQLKKVRYVLVLSLGEENCAEI